MGRVTVEEHSGQRIVMIDCRNCTPAEMIDVLEQVQDLITSQPPNSVSTLTDYTGAQFDREIFQRMKEVAAFDRPHIIRAAFIGVDTLPEVIHKGMENFSARRFEIFETREQALAYLTMEEAGRQTA